MSVLQNYLAASKARKRGTGVRTPGTLTEDGGKTDLVVPSYVHVEEESSMLQTVVDTLTELPLLRVLHVITLFFLVWCVQTVRL